jgi:DNA modification methylase
MNGTKAQLIHADPPYGMGKEKDGVQNDNLYADKLDAFQMAWWRAFRPHAEDNASAYIWGNAEELWRLWYVGGLSKSERLTFRNEIVWDKKTAGAGGISHMGAEGFRQYPCSTERCLFFMLGEQGFNTNADNYWEGWEPIRKYLNDEMEKCGGTKNWKAALGNQMGGHYFTKSQWCFPTEEAYKKLQAFGKGDAFKREHDELKREHDELKREHDELKREFYGTRAYFDNTHDNMTDVWEFNRVTGEKRHGHATPKPIEMMARAIKSSTQDGGLLVEPFLGSGSTLIAAEQLGRKCYGMEISPAYCDVIVQRWENLTGKKAVLDKPTT